MFEKIKNDMVKAMKEQDKFRLSVIRMIKGSIDKERIDKKTSRRSRTSGSGSPSARTA